MLVMLIDTHAHINDDDLYPLAADIAADMPKDKLVAVINVGYDMPSSERAVALAEKYQKMFSAVGIHPHDSKTATETDYARIEQWASLKKTLAVGEIGLDYHYDLSPREVQQKVFVEQLALAHSLRLPTIIHLREGYGDMTRLLKDNARYTEYGILLHCYSGSKEFAAELLARYDAYFSFGGAVTFKNATEKPAVIRSIPKDRILLETDCPYMTPVPFRGKTNLPKYVNLVANKMSDILGIDREEVDSITTHNAKEFFKKINDSL